MDYSFVISQEFSYILQLFEYLYKDMYLVVISLCHVPLEDFETDFESASNDRN